MQEIFLFIELLKNNIDWILEQPYAKTLEKKTI